MIQSQIISRYEHAQAVPAQRHVVVEIRDRLLRFWCRIAHPPHMLTRPVRGHYRCLVCLQEFESWSEGKEPCQI